MEKSKSQLAHEARFYKDDPAKLKEADDLEIGITDGCICGVCDQLRGSSIHGKYTLKYARMETAGQQVGFIVRVYEDGFMRDDHRIMMMLHGDPDADARERAKICGMEYIGEVKSLG